MRIVAKTLAVLGLSALALQARDQPISGSLDVHWNEGALDCKATPQSPMQVHAYEPHTFIVRQNPCAESEANFIYLLWGSDKALLIDTGAIADSTEMPLAKTVMGLLPDTGGSKIPLLIVHTHSHRDHDAGDVQFASLPTVMIVPPDLARVRKFFRFADWPNGVAHLDLGGRTVDVIPAPGHFPDHLVFYDGRTGILFSGDFLLPGRLLIADAAAYHASAMRVLDFLGTRPLTHILGGHIELNVAGEVYVSGSHYHLDERRLGLTRQDLVALPGALEHFNGFYARHTDFVLSNPVHNLLALAIAAVAVLIFMVWGLRRFLRRRQRTATRAY